MEDIGSASHRRQKRNAAHYWRFDALGGVEMLTADFESQRFGRHWHPGYALGIVTRGAERFYCGGAHHIVGVGGIIAVNPGAIHDGEPASDEGWSYRMVYPTQALASEIAADYAGRDRAPITPMFREPAVWDAELAARFALAHRAAEAAQDKTGASRLEAETRLLVCIADLFHRHGGGADGGVASTHLANARRLEPALELINAALASDLSLDTLADAVGVGRFHFLRLFKACLGCPPHAYVLQRRVAKAKALLDRGMSAGDAALEAGFFDQSHFANAFRHTYGMTPRDYQRGCTSPRIDSV